DQVYRIKVFDYPGFKLDKENAWLRLRDEGDKITLTFKHRIVGKKQKRHENDEGMEEYEIIIDSYEKAEKIVLKLGLIQKFYEEKRRIRYMFGDIEFDIDFYPGLEPYLEIEAPTWERIDEAIKLIGLNEKDKKICSTTQIFKLKGIDMLDYEAFTFRGLVKRKDK
ncbi:hypothetical protein A2Y26_03520, partial [candidate division CPR2 bacterium GWD2_39_7]